MSGSRSPALMWYTKPNCGLCDAAWPHVARSSRLLRLDVTPVDVSDDPDLRARFGLRIPVLARGDDVLAEGAMSAWNVWRTVMRVRLRR